MTKKLGLLALVLPTLLSTAVGCADTKLEEEMGASDALRGLSTAEALSDLRQMGDLIRTYYGPLEYKKQKFGFDLDTALSAAQGQIEAAETEGDRVRALYTVLAQLRDGHVSMQYGLRGDESAKHSLLFIVMPIEQTYVVAGVGGGLPIGRGDELVSIDGLTPKQMADLITPFDQVGTPESSAHGIAASMTFRPFYAPKELAPKGATALCVFKKADGSLYELAVPWQSEPGGFAGQIQPATPAADPAAPAGGEEASAQTAAKKKPLLARDAMFSSRANFILHGPQTSVLQQGSLTPFYLTPAVTAKYAPVEVTPKAATLEKYGVTLPPAADPKAADFINLKAFKYKHAGKTVMIVRIPSYMVPQDNYDENVAWLSALIEDNAGSAAGTDLASTPADAIVLDDTHNPGGNAAYVTGLATLFLKAPSSNQVQANHSDRQWLEKYISIANYFNSIPGLPTDFADMTLARASKLEAAFDSGKWLAPFAPLAGGILGPKVELTAETYLGTDQLKPHPLGHWEKPVIVLHDELSGSGGDAFPQLLQASGIKTFGARTMGLGGSVEPVGQLTNSRAQLNLTRGLFGVRYNGRPEVTLIENEGVTPNYPYAHTVADFRAGYVGYVKAFSDLVTSVSGSGRSNR